MTDTDWSDYVDAATMRSIWQGNFIASRDPRLTVWWQAWQNVTGGMDVLHVGATCVIETTSEEAYNLAHRMLGGIAQMVWKSVGETLNYEVRHITMSKLANGTPTWTGRVVLRAYSGQDFDPLMIAIQETKKSVEET